MKGYLDLRAIEELKVKPVSSVVVEATGYCSCEKCCGKYSSGYTSTGAIKRNKIDIYFDNHKEALKFSWKKLKIYVLN